MNVPSELSGEYGRTSAVLRPNIHRTASEPSSYRILKLRVTCEVCNYYCNSFITFSTLTWNVFLLRLIIMDYSEYTKQRILFYWFKGIKPGTIALKLKEEGIDATCSRVGVWKFLKRYENHGTIHRKPGSGTNQRRMITELY